MFAYTYMQTIHFIGQHKRYERILMRYYPV